ncbi:TIGR03936 family radical SAM-associated protein [Tepidibacter formicigenes]|jgi:radical SAM-linked protein|uniref:Radical SAM-linked protein n=1 Tax=Tepidibacter formicigenes DSM 15518 TaxID=1123349 RepID=A0A1M6JZ51_9FIRM|nr:TIGR03936 family radical SAM-associated protein [Tepidibacter formicigenes]SHJ51976.1 radical SAM-linked protein [Tepidibacter formicigenes DSM 15518]
MSILRCKFTKEKDMIYISHLDLQRLLQRSLRRAGIKVSYSQGFNPHPKISFGQALSLGTVSFGEYIDIELDEDISEDDFLTRINNALPDGVKFLKAVCIDKSIPSLMSSISHGSYTLEIKVNDNITIDDIKAKIDEFMKKDEIVFIKKTKKGKLKEVNIRPLIRRLNEVSLEDNILILNAIISTGSSGNLNPNTLVEKLSEVSNLNMDIDNIKIIRNDLYSEDNKKLITPI